MGHDFMHDLWHYTADIFAGLISQDVGKQHCIYYLFSHLLKRD
jgi:hypothetical protein